MSFFMRARLTIAGLCLLAFTFCSSARPDTTAVSGQRPDSPAVQSEGVRSSRIARWGLSLNAADLAWYGTLNADAQLAVARHISLEAAVKYNPWTMNGDDPESRTRSAQRSVSLGARWWPWYVYSGWWLSAAAQWQEYSRGNLFSFTDKEEGDALGLAAAGGYSVHVNPWLNIDFGLGFWGGYTRYRTYSYAGERCPRCGLRTDAPDGSPSSSKFFLLPDEALVSVMFVF